MAQRSLRDLLSERLNAPEGFTIADEWEATCDKFPNRPAFQYVGCETFPERSMSFAQMDTLANQVAHWALHVEGFKPRDTIALYMENRIEYVAFWLGLCKAGIRTAFVNNTIKLHPLIHSIAVAKAKAVIFGIELQEQIGNVFRELIRSHGIECLCSGGTSQFAREIDSDIFKQSGDRLDPTTRAGIKFTDVFGYVYTSGTTGLPKAVNVTHLKQWAFGCKYGDIVTEKDVVYSSGMPLYHSSAGGIGTGMVLHYGACQIIRRKFSAKSWLSDVRRYNATVCQYIGELCRYIYAQPEQADDGNNTLRLATGNGLSKEIWVAFQTRFKIDTVVEFYGSTEGNGAFRTAVHLANLLKGDTSGVGCVGRLEKSNKIGVRFVRFDVDKDDLVRDPSSGRLVDCVPGEPGECIFPVKDKLPGSKFVGYTDTKATEKKLIVDDGVTYVRTGDLLVVTEDRWIKFVDRIGDTFRWRGENVSTFEVASELARCPVVQEANVYGVQVPHVEGRAGMAAVVFRESDRTSIQASLEELLEHAKQNLPSYAIPLFIRVQDQTATTQTFKHQKVHLRSDGINPANMGDDKLFWLHPDFKGYRLFSSEDFAELSRPPSGHAKL